MGKAKFNGFGFSVLSIFGTVTFLSFPASSQQIESFSSCVDNLDRRIHINHAIENCKQAFRGRPVNEEYTTCVDNLDRRIHINYAIEHCNDVFQNAAQPSENIDNGSNAANGTGNGTTIIINPGQNQQQPQQETNRRTRRVCVNTTFDEIWDDIHCQFTTRNSPFEWVDIYLD